MKAKYTIIPLICSLVLIGCAPKSISSISLDKTTISLEEDTTLTLNATTNVNNSTTGLQWSTSDKFVASVNDKGVVKALNEGDAVITVYSEKNPKVSATCNVSVVAKPEKADSEVNFSTYKMTTYRYTNSSTVKTNVYFRDDRLTKFAYISLKTYYNLLTNHNMTIAKQEDGTYKVTSANGEEAIINTETDTLTCADYQNFISSTIYRQDNVPNVYFDGAPFLRVKNVTHDKEAEPTTINFKKYNINLFGVGDDDIYLPVSTASNMFMGPTMITCFCTADTLYFVDPNDPKWETQGVIRNNRYINGVKKFLNEEKRTKEEARFAYGELCFLIDTYYGLPGREYIHEQLNQTRDLNKVLSEHSEVTKQARAYLLSTDVAEYLAGIHMLASFVSDAGHSVADYGASLIEMYDASLEARVSKALNAVDFDNNQYDAKSNVDMNYIRGLYNARANAQSVNNNGYVLVGDTLFYRFNQFDFDIYEWNEYYTHPSLSALPDDAVGNFKRMLDAYKDSTTVKNVVVDISINPGGYADVVAAFMGLMNKNTYQHSYDTIGRRGVTVNYEFDKNFDGVFDAHDQEVTYNYNFAVLSSGYSFSCGNLLPAQAKENGIALLGDKSGGGSCAVIDASSAEGLYVRLSCPDHLQALDGTDYEFGVPADYTLVGPNNDFSNFYNISLMSEKINEFYSH